MEDSRKEKQQETNLNIIIVLCLLAIGGLVLWGISSFISGIESSKQKEAAENKAIYEEQYDCDQYIEQYGGEQRREQCLESWQGYLEYKYESYFEE